MFHETMNNKKAFNMILVIVLLSLEATMLAQERKTILFGDFEQIKDTTSYKKQVGELFTSILRKKGVMPMEDVDKLIVLGEKLDFPKGLGMIYRVKGELHKGKLEYLMAQNSYLKSVEYFKKANNPGGVARANNDLFVTQYIRGNLEESTYYLLQSKKHYEHIKDSITLVTVNNNLAAIYWRLNDYKAAEKAFLQCLKLQPKNAKVKVKGTIMSNLGSIYMTQKKYKQAEEIIKKGIQLNKENEEEEGLGFSYGMLAEMYMIYNEFEMAKKYNDTALANFKVDPNSINNIRAKQRLAKIEVELGNYDNAEKILLKTRKSFNKAKVYKGLMDNYKLSATLDSIRGDFSGALSWLKMLQLLSERRMQESSAEKVATVETRYKRELEQLKKITEQEQQERASASELFVFRVFVFVSLVILLMSIFILVSVLEARKRRKQLITDLHHSNHIKNKLFSIISHDLKNEIHSLDSSLKLMKENQLSIAEFKQILPLLVQRTNQTSILLNNLLNWSKSQMNELSAKPVNFDIAELVAQKFRFFNPKAAEKNIQLQNELEETIVYADQDMIGIVIQNLMANAIKFCKPGDSVTFYATKKSNTHEITCSDTGVGIDPNNISKLFAEDTFTTRGTGNETGTGLGLKICKELIELNTGNIKVESVLGKGTEFTFTLPVAKNT